MNGRLRIVAAPPEPQFNCASRIVLIGLTALLLGLCTTGCGSFMARRIAQAPNTYPTWFAPKARVALAFSDKFLTNFPAQFVNIGPPSAQMRYRVVDPADFHLTISTTNWVENSKEHFKFTFRADLPGETNAWTASPRPPRRPPSTTAGRPRAA